MTRPLLFGCTLALGLAPAAAFAAMPSQDGPQQISTQPMAASPQAAPTRQHLAPAGWEDSYHDWHYTPVVVVGDTVIVSGIPAAVGATYEDKVRWMFEQLKAHLETAGVGLADVVELTSFHVGPKDTAAFQAEFARFAKIHHEYFPDHYPAWSAVGTTALLANGAPVEMRVVAIRGSGARPQARIPRPKPAAPPPAAATDATPAPATDAPAEAADEG
jgi:enamine deaminase RidA (YjgF/YER057c/UK114 family)